MKTKTCIECGVEKTIREFITNKNVSIGIEINRYTDYIPKEYIELLISQGWEFVNYNKNSKK